MLSLWWLAVHALAVLGVALSGAGAAAAGFAAAAAALHVWLRRPGPAPVVVRSADGRWHVPARLKGPLALGRGSSAGPYWAYLKLVGKGSTASILLLRDQLDEGSWRALQAELRRSDASCE